MYCNNSKKWQDVVTINFLAKFLFVLLIMLIFKGAFDGNI